MTVQLKVGDIIYTVDHIIHTVDHIICYFLTSNYASGHWASSILLGYTQFLHQIRIEKLNAHFVGCEGGEVEEEGEIFEEFRV